MPEPLEVPLTEAEEEALGQHEALCTERGRGSTIIRRAKIDESRGAAVRRIREAERARADRENAQRLLGSA